MRILNVGSGSKGNSTLIFSDYGIILIDAGKSTRSIKKALKTYNKSIDDIDAVFLTHTHIDHIKYLDSFPSWKIYALNHSELSEISFNHIEIGETINIKDITIEPLLTSHDSFPSCGYLIKIKDEEIVYITDTGYVPLSTLEKIKNKEFYILESNHDESMLLSSSRPLSLKSRILSTKGHLANDLAANYLNELIGDKIKGIFLAHLSEECNNPNEALLTLENNLSSKNKELIKKNNACVTTLYQREETLYDED